MSTRALEEPRLLGARRRRPMFEGVAVGLPSRGRGRGRRGRVQHRAVGLPGDPHRPVVRGPDHHVHVSAHRQLRHQRRRRPGRRAALPRRHRARPRAPCRRTGAPPTTSTASCGATASRASPASTPAASRATSAARVRCPARSAPPIRDTLLAAAQADGGTDGQDLGDGRHHADGRTPSGPTTRRTSSSRTTSASSARSSTSSSPPAARSKSCPRRRPPPTCSRASPTACSCRTVPAIRPRSSARRRTSRRCSARCRSSASASGTRSWASRSAPSTFKLQFGHHGGNHPVRHLASGRVEITSQNHNYAVDADSLPDGVVVSHLNLNDGDVEGVRCDRLRAFSVQYHPGGGPRPARRALPVPRVHRAR